MKVATPWSLSHYIPLNGFHPLYRALFDYAPDTIEISSWDNVKLRRILDVSPSEVAIVTKEIKQLKNKRKRNGKNITSRKYDEFFSAENYVLTALLRGEVEFVHTAPFPTMTRPFVFHCEAFAPVFLPFSQQGGGAFEHQEELKEHYRKIFSSPYCIGIFSHVNETLESFKRFFKDPFIDAKLHLSKIGLSEKSYQRTIDRKENLSKVPRFLFINSAHQNPANFVKRGGQIVLKFWKIFRSMGYEGQLFFRCSRPSEDELQHYGVDNDFVLRELGRSIFWGEDYLSNSEMNALMESSDFFLLPSASLHSASILQAMALGSIPIVTDTVGVSTYVSDNINGVILKGVREAIWFEESNTGILYDDYSLMRTYEDSLVDQLYSRVIDLIGRPSDVSAIKTNISNVIREKFSGEAFAKDFWNVVQLRMEEYIGSSRGDDRWFTSNLNGCLVEKAEWARIFESVPQPVKRINTGNGLIFELGGVSYQAWGNPDFELRDWSVMANFTNPGSPAIALDYEPHKQLEALFSPFKSTNTVRQGGSDRKSSVSGVHDYSPKKIAEHYFRFRDFFKRAKRFYLKNYFNFRRSDDIELIEEGYLDYNIIRYFHLYFAIKRSEGAFSIDRVFNKDYSKIHRALSYRSIIRKIEDERQGF